MRIVIDTNVVISGTFFKGNPRRIVEATVENKFSVFATPEIIQEYNDIINEFIIRKQGNLDNNILNQFIASLNIINQKSFMQICRDSDDDKFINCAIDSKSLYIVSGDNDLLVLGKYNNIDIITATQFCKTYLDDLL